MKKGIIALILCFLLLLMGATTVFAGDMGMTPSGEPLSDIEEIIDDYMARHIGESSPGAAVVLVKGGQIIFSKGYGYADIENEIKVSPDKTVFEYGSISKLFVHTTIMRLAEQGKIDLGLDIREYLPKDFLNKLQYDKPITMIDIMNHTTGFEDYLFDLIWTSPEKLPTIEEVLTQSQPRQVYEPGTISAYSNYVVSLEAYIVQQMCGQDFHEYLMKTMFVPLGMDSTSIHPTLEDRPELVDNKAKGYYPQGNGGFAEGDWSYIPMYPAGAANGTAEDLAQFAIALMPEEGQKCVLFEKSTTLDEMLTQTYDAGSELSGIAHGFFEWDGEFRGVGHGGGTAAFTSQINIVPEQRFGVIVLTNAASEMDITKGLTEALIGKQDTSVTAAANDLPDASKVQGAYIPARRMHSGFLEFYGFFSLINVQKVEQNKIRLSIGGQTATLMQTSPYVYQCVDASHPMFKYYLRTVFFDLSDGQVKRLAAGYLEYLPLPAGRTMPWLVASMLAAALGTLYFLIAPFVLLFRKLRNKNSAPSKLRNVRHALVFSGTLLLVNNAVLIIRMLINNYRSFSEMRIHILLNYPLVALAAVLTVLLIVQWKGADQTRWQKIFCVITLVLLAALIAALISWQFLNVIA